MKASQYLDAVDTANGWAFFTNHARVLISIARDSEARLRDLAAQVGITERAVQRIVTDLQTAGYLTVMKQGRRNSYRIHSELPLRHPIEGHRSIKALLLLAMGSQ